MTGTTTTRRYGVNAGMAIKVPVQAASTGNLTLSGEQTVDGIALVEDDRCLVKDQTDAIDNGIWDVSTGSWRRSPDFDGIADVTEGTLVPVNAGAANGLTEQRTIWRVTTTGEITPGTDEIEFILSALGAAGTTTDLVAHDGEFAGSGIRTVQDRFNDILQITDFDDVDKTGATDSTTGIQAARNYIASLSNPVKLVWPAGIYKYSVSPNWAITDLDMETDGDVRLRYTGTGNAMIFDGGAAGGGVFGIRAGRFYIESPTTAGHGVYMRSIHHGKFEFNVRGCGSSKAGLITEWCVLNEFRLIVSVNEGSGWYDDGSGAAKPLYGYYSSRREAGFFSAYNTFINPILEGVGTGIYLLHGSGEQFRGGASEGNTILGAYLAGAASLNVFDGMDFESNAGGTPTGYDVEVNSWQNVFNGIASDSMFKLKSTARFNRINSCSLFNIEIEAGAKLNSFNQCTYDRHGVEIGTYVDNGTDTLTRDLISPRTGGVYPGLGRAAYNAEHTSTQITVTGSPFTYTNTTGYNVGLLIAGGIVTGLIYQRPTGTSTTLGVANTGAIGYVFELSPGDVMQITYSSIPTVIIHPR